MPRVMISRLHVPLRFCDLARCQLRAPGDGTRARIVLREGPEVPRAPHLVGGAWRALRCARGSPSQPAAGGQGGPRGLGAPPPARGLRRPNGHWHQQSLPLQLLVRISGDRGPPVGRQPERRLPSGAGLGLESESTIMMALAVRRSIKQTLKRAGSSSSGSTHGPGR